MPKVTVNSAQRIGSQLKVQVETDDLGADNRGGVRLSDGARQLDAKLTWVSQKAGRDVFEAVIDVPASFDEKQLGVQAFVDVPTDRGTIDRLWGAGAETPAPVDSAQAQWVDGGKLKLELTTSDLGNDNRGGVMLSDASGKRVEVGLTWQGKAGERDRFSQVIDVPPGLDVRTLAVQSYVDVPNEAGLDRLWSANSVAVPGAVDVEKLLAANVLELASLAGQVAEKDARVVELTQAIRKSLASVEGDEQRLRGLRSDLERAQRDANTARVTVGLLGIFAAPFTGGASLLATAGAAVSAAMDNTQRQINQAESSLANTQRQLADLQNQLKSVETQRTTLKARADELSTAATPFATTLTASPAHGLDDLARLSKANDEATRVVAGYKALLGDYTLLEAQARRLGVDVDTLKKDIAAAVSGAEVALANVQRELQQALFSVAFSIVGAGAGLGALSAAEARLLRGGLKALNLFTLPPDQRPQAIASLLVSSLKVDLPKAQGLALDISKSLVLDAVKSPLTAARVVELAGNTALSDAQRALVQQLGAASTGLPLGSLVEAFAQGSDTSRRTALLSLEAWNATAG